ncbi:MAG TPA: hypothetical protein VEA99_15920 [Gemmatimonadaceae bacterium]|nr:hypothetical protein [Gemmatimonadaceae bacterium]
MLTLEFEDTGSYADYVEQGRDNPRGITQEQAAAVAAFVLRHRHRRAIVLHCAAGVSRSRSMAAAITEALKLPYEFTAVNDDVHRAVRRALLDARTSAKAEAVHRLFGAAAGGTSDDPRGEYRGHLRRKHGAGSEPPE